MKKNGHSSAPADLDDLGEMLDAIREEGWRVAVHNDYCLAGRDYTFWLFTNSRTGRYVKAEGESDTEAVREAMLLMAN